MRETRSRDDRDLCLRLERACTGGVGTDAVPVQVLVAQRECLAPHASGYRVGTDRVPGHDAASEFSTHVQACPRMVPAPVPRSASVASRMKPAVESAMRAGSSSL